MRRTLGKLVLFLGVAALLSSAGLLLYSRWDENRAHTSAARTARVLSEQIVQLQVPDPGDAPEDGADANMPLFEIDGERYIGLLSIPALELELPVNNELTYPNLRESPCRFTGDFSGAMVISAHNYAHHFGRLEELSPGDAVYITDAAGTVHTYQVELIETLHATDVDAMVNTHFDLTLFTCTPNRTDRLTVRSMRVPEPPPVRQPRAPNYRIDYRRETLRLRTGSLFSVDGGANFTEVAEPGGVTLDVSDFITQGAPIHVKRGADGRRPASEVQAITPLARPELTGRALTPVNGRLSLGRRYEVYDPDRGRWGGLPGITGNAEFAIRIRSAARASGGTAASLPGRLTVTYGEAAGGGTGIVAAEITTDS